MELKAPTTLPYDYSNSEGFNTLVAHGYGGTPTAQCPASEISKAYIDREELKTTVREGSPGLERSTSALKTFEAPGRKVKSLIESMPLPSRAELTLSRVDAEIKRLPVNERMLIGFERDFFAIDKMYTYLQEKRARLQ